MTRLIKKYKNRKMYDSTSHNYITLTDMGQLIKQGEDIKVVCHTTKQDITHNVLTQIVANNSEVILGNVDVLTKLIKSVSDHKDKSLATIKLT